MHKRWMVLKKTRLLFIAGSLCKRRKANEYFLLTAIRSVKNLIVILSNILPLFNLTPQCKKAKCMMKQFYTLHIPPQGHKASIQHQKRFWLAASALIKRNIGDFSFPDSRSKTACRGFGPFCPCQKVPIHPKGVSVLFGVRAERSDKRGAPNIRCP